jgi:hypothetical protein
MLWAEVTVIHSQCTVACSVARSSYLDKVFAYWPGFPSAAPQHCVTVNNSSWDLACATVINTLDYSQKKKSVPALEIPLTTSAMLPRYE